MGEAFLCKRGSGSAETAVSACGFVCASVPQGSSCSCIQGDKRFSVDNAPGLVAFAVPACGAWTVTISDGMRTKSGSVTSSAAGEVKTIQLSYPSDPVVSEEGVLLSAQQSERQLQPACCSRTTSAVPAPLPAPA